MILSNSIGTLIVRSSRQKLYSTILMTLSTLLIMFPIMMVSFLNGYVKGAGRLDFPLLPYLRGYYDVVAAPLSPGGSTKLISASCLRAYLGLLVL